MPKVNQTKDELKQAIKDIFRLEDETYVEDYATIGVFLQDAVRVTAALKDLEAKMIGQFALGATAVSAVTTAARQRLLLRGGTAVGPDLSDATHKASFGRDPGFKQKYHGCLAKALLTLEQSNQFSLGFAKSRLPQPLMSKEKKIKTDLATHLDPQKGVPVLTGIVKPGHFNSILLANGSHWKDPGVSPDHGEYTHRIQWYAICNGGLKLTHQPIDLFKKLSSAECFFYLSKDDEKADRNSHSLWFFLFDCADAASFPTVLTFEESAPWAPATANFRSPEYFNRWMIMAPSAVTDFPFLSQYLADRYYKRDVLGVKALQEQLETRYADKYGTKISTRKIA